MFKNINKYLVVAQKADFVVGLACLAASGFFVYEKDYVYAGLLFVGGVVSLLSAKYQPAKYVARKILISKLKG